MTLVERAEALARHLHAISNALTSHERQFLFEASNEAGRVAGHNNKAAAYLHREGLVVPISRGIPGQSNYHITDKGLRALKAASDANV